MPVDWDELDDEMNDIIAESAAKTDSRLASKISSLSRMTDEDVKELFPDPADVKKLTNLMKVVKSSEDRNKKINSIVNNAEEFGGIVLSLLSKYV